MISYIKNPLLLFFVIFIASGCSSNESTPKDIPPTINRTPSPPVDQTPLIAPPSIVRTSFISATLIQVSWLENYEIVDPETAVNVQICSLGSICAESDYYTAAYSYQSSAGFSVLPATSYKVRVRAEKNLETSNWVDLGEIRSADLPFFMGLDMISGSSLFRVGETFSLVQNENGTFSETITPAIEITPASGYSYFSDGNSVESFSKTVFFSGINELGEKRIVLQPQLSFSGSPVLGDYNLTNNPVVDKEESTSLFSEEIFFVSDSASGDLSTLFSVNLNNSELKAQRISDINNISEIEEFFGTLYFIAPSLLDPQKLALFSLSQNRLTREIYTSSSVGNKLKNLTISNQTFSSFLIEESPLGTFSLLKLNLFPGTVEQIISPVGDLNSAAGLVQKNGLFVAESAIDSQEKIIFSTVDQIERLNSSKIYHQTLVDGKTLAIEVTGSEKRLIFISSSENQLGEKVTTKVTLPRQILFVESNKENAPPFVLVGSNLYFESIDSLGNGLLSKVSLDNLSQIEEISPASDNLSTAGLAFSNGKIFYVTESNKLYSYSIGTGETRIEHQIAGVKTEFGIGINQENWFIYKNNGSYLVGLNPTEPIAQNKEKALFLIDTFGKSQQIFDFSQQEPSGFIKINKIF